MNNVKKAVGGKVLVPALLWLAGAPFGLVVILWFLFFRGR
jgi:hypothetical protein